MNQFKVNQFYEKPGTAVAKSFLETGKFSWNSGIFLFSIRTVLQELTNYAPEILKPLQNQGIDAYETLPKISIDYALMEKTEHAYVLPAEFGWDDLGDWRSLERLLPPDAVTNVCVGNHHAFETERAIVYSDNPNETVVTLGVSDVVVVRQGDVTLIVDKHRTQDIKKILGYLPKNLL